MVDVLVSLLFLRSIHCLDHRMLELQHLRSAIVAGEFSSAMWCLGVCRIISRTPVFLASEVSTCELQDLTISLRLYVAACSDDNHVLDDYEVSWTADLGISLQPAPTSLELNACYYNDVVFMTVREQI